MPGELNRPKCLDCGETLTDSAIAHATEQDTQDHEGLCCDCYQLTFFRSSKKN